MAHSEAGEENILYSGKLDFQSEFLPRIIRYFLPENLQGVLEIGCGFGRMTTHIAQYCSPKHVFAVDISPKLLEIAKSRCDIYGINNVSFIETSGDSLLGIPDNSITFAFEYIVFQHISDYTIVYKYLKELFRVLQIGGILVMHIRDVSGVPSETNSGNTWHGCRMSPEFIGNSLKGIPLKIFNVEGIGTDRCWIHIKKESTF